MGEKKYLWSFYWDCGRSGSLDGLFVATEREINEVLGNEVYFGEVLGKHSEVYGTLDEGDVHKLDISPEAVEEVSNYLGDTWSGFNPLEYVRYTCEICEESMSLEDWNCVYREDLDVKACDECYEEEINKTP